MDALRLWPGDVIFTRSRTLLGWLIRAAETAPGELPTYASHVAIIGPTGETVIESAWKTIETPWVEWAIETGNFMVFRKAVLDDGVRIAIAKKAREYVGDQYGFWKLAFHLGDAVLTRISGYETRFFRRFLFMDRYPICSWPVAFSYFKAANYVFGCNPEAADPDCMNDHILAGVEKGDWHYILTKADDRFVWHLDRPFGGKA